VTLHLVEPGAQRVACDSILWVVLDTWEHRSWTRVALFA
jgi:hypothetical protein